MRLEPKDERHKVNKRGKDALAEMIGICEGPENPANRHDSCACWRDNIHR
jgi:hypothetical protein